MYVFLQVFCSYSYKYNNEILQRHFTREFVFKVTSQVRVRVIVNNASRLSMSHRIQPQYNSAILSPPSVKFPLD